jgi:hypothetical protein
MRRERSDPYVALIASVLLHVAGLAVALFLIPKDKPSGMGEVTTVTLVTSADVANLRPTVESPTPTDAASPTPTAPDQAAPPPAAGPPAQPTPPNPQGQGTAKPTPAKPQPAWNPNTVLREVDPHERAMSRQLAGGKPGATRQQAGPQAAPGAQPGQTASAADTRNLSAALEKLWNVNCDSDSDVSIDVSFTVGPTGRLQGDDARTERSLHAVFSPQDDSKDPPTMAALIRARSAVHKLEPFTNFRGIYGKTVTRVHFNSKEACAKR